MDYEEASTATLSAVDIESLQRIDTPHTSFRPGRGRCQ